MPCGARGWNWLGDRAYLARFGTLIGLDLSDPIMPQQRASLAIGNTIEVLEASGEFA